jgi:3-hydroxybutyryl-CoA dehydrogenase
MGSGIAQVAAQAGFDTIVREVSEPLAAKARSSVERSLDKAIEKGKLDAAGRASALGRMQFTTALTDVARADIVIEAIVERLEIKNALWKELDALAPAHTIFASNTSSLTIAAMAASHGRADRMVGLHFFNPVPAMKLVEVVRTVTTSDETFDSAFKFATRLGKVPIAAKDQSGFVVNLLLIPYLLDAIRAVERRVASVTDIDTGMTLGTGHPMGPLSLSDFVGLDTLFNVANVMYEEYAETRYAPPPLLKRMVLAGMLGKKSGRGFYDYSATPPIPTTLGL